MSTPELIVDQNETNDDVNLDDFNDLFHGKTVKEPEVKDDDPEDEDNESDNANIEQNEETQENDEEDADLANEDDEEDEAPRPKSRVEKRIEQLLEKARLAEERAKAAEAALNKQKELELPKPTPVVKTDDKAPHFEDKNEDGTDKYPLGQFDPAFQEDHVKYLLNKGLAEQKAALEREAQEAEARRTQEALTTMWTEKLETAKERYPDFTEKGENLLETFSGIPQEYGEYLTATIMTLENGPDVLYFLSENINEAERIINLGPTGAAIALGRIDARFEQEDEEDKPKPRPKVSKAPAPPPRNKGSNAAIAEVPDDTDDLDAFSSKLFKKG